MSGWERVRSAPFSATLGVPFPMPPAPRCLSPPCSYLPTCLTFRWRFQPPVPLTAVAWAAWGDELSFVVLGGRRKLARLRVAKRLPRRRGLGTPHLQRERPGRAGPGPSPAIAGQSTAEPGWKAEPEAGRTERSKECGLFARESHKVHVHGSHPHDRQRPSEGPNNS